MPDFILDIDTWLFLKLNAGAANAFFDWLMGQFGGQQQQGSFNYSQYVNVPPPPVYGPSTGYGPGGIGPPAF